MDAGTLLTLGALLPLGYAGATYPDAAPVAFGAAGAIAGWSQGRGLWWLGVDTYDEKGEPCGFETVGSEKQIQCDAAGERLRLKVTLGLAALGIGAGLLYRHNRSTL